MLRAVPAKALPTTEDEAPTDRRGRANRARDTPRLRIDASSECFEVGSHFGDMSRTAQRSQGLIRQFGILAREQLPQDSDRCRVVLVALERYGQSGDRFEPQLFVGAGSSRASSRSIVATSGNGRSRNVRTASNRNCGPLSWMSSFTCEKVRPL